MLCPDLRPAAFLGAQDAQGAHRIDVREVDLCFPWEGGLGIDSMLWLPHTSGELTRGRGMTPSMEIAIT